MKSTVVRPCTFFVECNPYDVNWRPAGFDRGKWLKELFFAESNTLTGSLASRLKDGGHSVALALLQFDEDTADVVRSLNDMQVPVIAWLTLPEKQGYWSNSSNVADTIARIDQLLTWMDWFGISFSSLGVDWEPPIQMHLSREGKKIYPRAFQYYLKKRNPSNIRYLQDTLSHVKSLGIGTELYVMPKLLSPFLGLSEQPEVDRRVIMAYSTVLGSIGSTKLATRLMAYGYPTASMAYGIASHIKGSSPGRDFGDGGLPRHLLAPELAKCIEATPIVNKRQPSYLFAMNSPRTLNFWETAMKLAREF